MRWNVHYHQHISTVFPSTLPPPQPQCSCFPSTTTTAILLFPLHSFLFLLFLVFPLLLFLLLISKKKLVLYLRDSNQQLSHFLDQKAYKKTAKQDSKDFQTPFYCGISSPLQLRIMAFKTPLANSVHLTESHSPYEQAVWINTNRINFILNSRKTSSAIIFNCVENGINRRSYTGLIDVVNRLPR